MWIKDQMTKRTFVSAWKPVKVYEETGKQTKQETSLKEDLVIRMSHQIEN